MANTIKKSNIREVLEPIGHFEEFERIRDRNLRNGVPATEAWYRAYAEVVETHQIEGVPELSQRFAAGRRVQQQKRRAKKPVDETSYEDNLWDAMLWAAHHFDEDDAEFPSNVHKLYWEYARDEKSRRDFIAKLNSLFEKRPVKNADESDIRNHASLRSAEIDLVLEEFLRTHDDEGESDLETEGPRSGGGGQGIPNGDEAGVR